jgi:hypothetical protein
MDADVAEGRRPDSVWLVTDWDAGKRHQQVGAMGFSRVILMDAGLCRHLSSRASRVPGLQRSPGSRKRGAAAHRRGI